MSSCEERFCKKYFVPMMVRKIQGFQKKIVPKSRMKQLLQSCKQGYCNPGCKTTIFQNGKNFPKNLVGPNGKKYSKLVKEFVKESRKNIFKNKTSVLKNSFFTGIKKKNVKCAKNKGAASGCTLFIMQ
jgi:hypothetical protein